MTTDNTQAQSSVADSFAYLYPYEFVVLTTFRRDGREVPTTVWFTHDNGKNIHYYLDDNGEDKAYSQQRPRLPCAE